MKKPLEEMTQDEINAIKEEIAEACKIDLDKGNVQILTWEEACEKGRFASTIFTGFGFPDFIVSSVGSEKPQIEMLILPSIAYNLGFYACSFSGEIFRVSEHHHEKSLVFVCCEFKKTIHVMQSIVDDLKFFNCVFEEEVRFYQNSFEGKMHFVAGTFKKAVSFLGSIFKGEVHFDESEFQKNVYFSEAIFFRPPSFLGVNFKDQIDLVNADLNFGYGELKGRIGNSAKIANDYRDSFRLIKNNLLKNNNTLDASQYHKMELYCKEIELVARIKEAIFPPKIKENRKEKTLSFAEQSLLPLAMDFLQLWFYRKTSDHHTNLLRIIAWVVACIGLFGYVLLGIFASDKEIAISWFGVSKILPSVDSWIVSVGCLGIVVACLLVRWVEWLVGGIGLLLGVWILTSRPSYFVDLFKGSLLDGRFDRWQNATLLVHVILLGLLLFSLQKTARKNTIIPS